MSGSNICSPVCLRNPKKYQPIVYVVLFVFKKGKVGKYPLASKKEHKNTFYSCTVLSMLLFSFVYVIFLYIIYYYYITQLYLCILL